MQCGCMDRDTEHMKVTFLNMKIMVIFRLDPIYMGLYLWIYFSMICITYIHKRTKTFFPQDIMETEKTNKLTLLREHLVP